MVKKFKLHFDSIWNFLPLKNLCYWEWDGQNPNPQQRLILSWGSVTTDNPAHFWSCAHVTLPSHWVDRLRWSAKGENKISGTTNRESVQRLWTRLLVLEFVLQIFYKDIRERLERNLAEKKSFVWKLYDSSLFFDDRRIFASMVNKSSVRDKIIRLSWMMP